MTITGYDRSKWQGETTLEQVQYALDNHLFVILKATQGISHIDPRFHDSAEKYTKAGVPWTAYHFTTNEDGPLQARNFYSQISGYKLSFKPWLDCEAYAMAGGEAYSVRAIAGNPYMSYQFFVSVLAHGSVGVVYPSEDRIYSLASSLQSLMNGEPPGIYTNPGSGDTIFKGKYAYLSNLSLWVAHWDSPGKPPLERPRLPKIWQKRDRWYFWQRRVVDGAPYLIDGKLDYNEFGNEVDYPYPVDPVDPSVKKAKVSILIAGEDRPWVGELEQEVK